MASAPRRVKVYFDGGCRPNPGRMEAAVVIRGAVHVFDDLGLGTSRDAEWLALIRALELCRTMGFTGVELIGDSRDVIGDANRVLAEGALAQGHTAAFLALAGEVRPARIRWIRRHQNLAGVALNARHPR